MTMWLPVIAENAGPRYQAIADAIAAAVAGGELQPGDRLPPQRELAYRLGVTVGTVSRAYSLAERNGLLAGEVGRGTFVRDRQSHAGPDMLLPVSDVTVDLGINMACGPEHGTALRAALARLAETGGLENLLPYMPLGGHIEHRAAGAGWLTGRGVDVAPEQVVLTNGAQHGLAVALAAAAEPGATVMVESLTYAGVLGTASFVGRRIAGVAMDEDGVLPDALDMTALRTGAKVAVLVPTIHNPTALVMSEARRQAIAEVARRRNLIVIEDDVYGRLPVDSPPPLAAIIPERTIYVSSASKTLAPGLRVGWVVAPPDYVAAIAGAAFASSVAQPALTHEIVRGWIEDGTAETLVKTLRSEMAARQDIAAGALAGFELRAHPNSFHLLLDLPEPWTAGGFVEAALNRGIRVTPASAFAVDEAASPNAVRISVAAARDRETLATALATLAEMLRSRGFSPASAVV